jgi:hypothetical protein
MRIFVELKFDKCFGGIGYYFFKFSLMPSIEGVISGVG